MPSHFQDGKVFSVRTQFLTCKTNKQINTFSEFCPPKTNQKDAWKAVCGLKHLTATFLSCKHYFESVWPHKEKTTVLMSFYNKKVGFFFFFFNQLTCHNHLLEIIQEETKQKLD